MADRSILYRLRAALQGGKVAVAQEVEVESSHVGVLSGISDVESGLGRIDATGVGADVFSFTGAYSAQASNISEWFGGKQLARLRCTAQAQGIGDTAINFDLPGTTALNTAFDQLQTLGIAESLTFVIEYTGDQSNFVRIRPRTAPSPQITGATSIIVRSGIAATLEITRESGTISPYIWRAIGQVGSSTGSVGGEVTLISPSVEIWDASENGPLPDQSVVKGNAYKVVNAPSDGSGRFNEVMQNGDWVVWEGETFTSWGATPVQWFVLSAHEVRRITALEQDFLTDVQLSPESDRNAVVRGANYADSAGEIRLKIYPNRADYTAADLNTTGDVDEFQDASAQTGYLGIRLTGNIASLASVLPTLYVYSELDSQFTRILNLQTDFTHQGDFGAESDYLSNDVINYPANAVLRIYIGSVLDRYNNPSLDIEESNLSDELQAKVNRTDGGGTLDEQRLSAVESKVSALFPLTPDVTVLDEWANVIGPRRTVQEVSITAGYSLIADFRDSSTRYESSDVVYDDTGSNVVRYTGLGDNLYRAFGFKVTTPSDQILMWLVDGSTLIPFVDMTSAGNFRINAYRSEVGEDQVVRNQLHVSTKIAGPATLGPNDGNVQTFGVADFPTNATEQRRFFQAGVDIFVNGTDTLAEHIITIEAPATNAANSRQSETDTIPLGPLHGNRSVTVTVGYTFRLSGADLVVDWDLGASPSDVTVNFKDTFTILNYTAPGATTRVDNFTNFQDESGDYVFAGENELLVTFQPHISGNFLSAVGAAIGATGAATEFNDINVPIPEHSFESVEIPDTIDFRTFSPEHFLVHSDLSHLLVNRNVQWCYGLARLLTIRELTITEAVDFTAPTESGNRLVSVVTGTAAPTVTPDFTGQIFVDTTNKTVYVATGNAGSGDWVLTTN